MGIIQSELPWFAVQTRSNQEKIAKALLTEKGVPTFLPLRLERSRRRDKVVELESPLFPGYLFCQFAPEDRGPVVTVKSVVRVVGLGRTPIAVEPAEISAVRAIVASGAPYMPWPYVGVGDRVRIVAGPLAGTSGILTGQRGVDRVVVSIGLIQQSVAVEVKRSWLAPARTCRTIIPVGTRRKQAASAGRS